jgi:hypothetical protein
MPAPTFTSITPAVGLSGGGDLRVILGTGFDVQAVLGDPIPEVSVLFGTLPARRIQVTSTTRLTCLPPRGEILEDATFLDVDLTITNEDQGLPNSVVAADAYRYRRPDLSKLNESHLATVARTIRRRLMQQVIANVAMTTHTDFDESTADLMNRVALAKLPAIILVGPTLELLPIVNNNAEPAITLPVGDPEPTDFEARDQIRQVNMTYEVRLLSSSKKEMLNLIQACYGFHQRNEYLTDVLRDPLTPAAGVVRYPLRIVGDFAASDVQSRANVREAVGSWLIEGVLLENGDIVESAPTLDTVVVRTQQLP